MSRADDISARLLNSEEHATDDAIPKVAYEASAELDKLSDMLTRLTEKVERVFSHRQSGGTLPLREFSELQGLAIEARGLLDDAQPAAAPGMRQK